ncbi:MAG: PAS domain S-box protein, partial [Nitrospirota bacterium]
IVESAPNGMIMLNQQGAIMSVNAQAERQFGYSREELQVSHIENLIPERFRPQYRDARDTHLDASATRVLSQNLRFTGLRKDGTEFPFELTLTLINTSASQQVLASIVDISERLQAEEERGRHEAELERFKATLDQTHDCVFMFDSETLRFTYCNRGASEHIGYNKAELLALTPVDIKPEFTLERFQTILQPLFDGTQPSLTFETLHRHKDGHDIPVEAFLQLVRQTGKAPHFVNIVRDITERKATSLKLEHIVLEMADRNLALANANKKAIEATQAKSEFLASMSHEIRTPMNAIIGMADLLQDTPLTEEQQEYVSRFGRAATSLTDLINDILDLTKIETGHLELESVPIHLADLVDKIAELMAVRANAKALELVAFVHPDVPSYVMGDPTRLRQVLVNLLSNAIKFTEQGEVILRIDPIVDKPGLHAFCFSVSDTGIGIPADKIQTIFESFTQVDSTTTRKYGGTGLGLSISKRIVELMGSRIEVASMEGHGSTLSFSLHMAEVPGFSPLPNRPTLDLNGYRMLVVDDNGTNRMIVREFLLRMGVILSEATDGQTALTALDEAQRRGEPFQLAILDYHMPGMNGLELAQAIRARPAFAALPLVMHASDMRGDQTNRARALGIVDYVHKPLSRARLVASLTEALSPTRAILAAPVRPASPPPAALRPLHILLAEDLEDNRDVVALYVKGTPYVLDMAENGAIALKKFRTNTYDLVFMDIQMPVMDGYQATEAIREWEREQQRTPTPIVAFTANAFKEDLEMSLAVGCVAHLTKPLRKQALLNAIAEHARRPSKQTV